MSNPTLKRRKYLSLIPIAFLSGCLTDTINKSSTQDFEVHVAKYRIQSDYIYIKITVDKYMMKDDYGISKFILIDPHDDIRVKRQPHVLSCTQGDGCEYGIQPRFIKNNFVEGNWTIQAIGVNDDVVSQTKISIQNNDT